MRGMRKEHPRKYNVKYHKVPPDYPRFPFYSSLGSSTPLTSYMFKRFTGLIYCRIYEVFIYIRKVYAGFCFSQDRESPHCASMKLVAASLEFPRTNSNSITEVDSYREQKYQTVCLLQKTRNPSGLALQHAR